MHIPNTQGANGPNEIWSNIHHRKVLTPSFPLTRWGSRLPGEGAGIGAGPVGIPVFTGFCSLIPASLSARGESASFWPDSDTACDDYIRLST